MKNILAIFLVSGIISTSQAQQKMLSMEDAMVNSKTTLSPENLRQLQFIKGTHEYVYLKKVGTGDIYVKGGMQAAEEQTFLTLAQLNGKLKAASMDTLASLPPIQFSNDRWVTTIKGQKISIDPVKNSITTIISKDISIKENVEESKAGFVAYVDNYNLFVAGNGNTKKVTTDGSEDIVYASTVHQSEFGITKGTFWSNDGHSLAFYRMDQHMTPGYPIIDWSQRPAKVKNLRYPMAGDSSHHVTLAVYNALTDKTTWIKTEGPAEQYLTNVCWSPDDKYIFIAILNRGQDDMQLNQYDAATGEFIKTILKESDKKYVEPLVPMLFVKNSPGKFIWQSKKDGWNHLYLYNLDGSLIKQLTKGNWEVTDVKGFDEKSENIFYVSTQESPLTKDLYEINLKTGITKKISNGPGVHNVLLSSDGKYAIDNFNSAANARTIVLKDLTKDKSKTLLQASNPLAGFSLGKMNVFTIRNKEGDDLYCRLFMPAGFDSTKKYPVIVYWYGGPHVQMISAGWNGGAGDYWFQYMAERGYVVFSLDTRGSSNRGRAFEQSIFRHAGDAQMEDLMSGIQYLNNLPYADKDRMGLFGWSYGRFLTTDFMLNHPGIFKAAVAGGPVMDWRYYEIMYTERYMDTPAENPVGFESTNLVKQAGKLKGKLLLIHGLQDPTVVQQHSVMFVRAAIDKGVQVDYMIYPGHEHNVLGKDRAHLYQKVTDYLMQNLQ